MNNNRKNPRASLFQAIRNNKPKQVRLALKAGADVDATNQDGETALDLACSYEYVECVRELLQAGAKPDLRPEQELLPTRTQSRAYSAFYQLYYNEAQSDKAITKITRLLLQYGADVHVKDRNLGQTALFYAVGHEHLQSMYLLLKAGADIDATSHYWGSAICWASYQRAWGSVEYLLECGANPFICRLYPQVSAFTDICRKNKAELLRIILEHWAPSQEELLDGLQAALASSSLDCVDVLMPMLQHIKASPQGKPILLPAYDCKEELIAPLVKLGADMNESNRNGDTLLTMACSKRSLELVTQLIALGANVNHRNQQGITALHRAARRRRPDIAQALIAAGADRRALNDKGESPLDIARRYQRHATSAYLESCQE